MCFDNIAAMSIVYAFFTYVPCAQIHVKHFTGKSGKGLLGPFPKRSATEKQESTTAEAPTAAAEKLKTKPPACPNKPSSKTKTTAKTASSKSSDSVAPLNTISHSVASVDEPGNRDEGLVERAESLCKQLRQQRERKAQQNQVCSL